VALFNLGVDKTSRLLLVIHHLVVDGVSWRILVEDLQTTHNWEGGDKATIQNDLVQAVVRATAEYASAVVQQELDYWLAEPRKHVSHLPDYPGS